MIIIDCITLIGILLAKNYLIYACYTFDSIILIPFVLATTEEYSLNSSSSLYSCFFPSLVLSYHCLIVIHWYYDSFNRYHLHNMICVEIAETLYVGFRILDGLKNPLGIFFRLWLFIELNPFLESKHLVFPYSCFARYEFLLWNNTC